MNSMLMESQLWLGAPRVVNLEAQNLSKNEGKIDARLVDRVRNGDVEAFRLLVEKYQSRAHSIALGVLGNFEDAEEVAQEAFLKAYRNLSTFRGQSSFYTWFYRIVYNLAIDFSRKSYRRSEISCDEPILGGIIDAKGLDSNEYMAKITRPDEELERLNLQKGFRTAIEELSAEHRAVVLLREIEGRSYAEISDIVGCSKGTVMSRLYHARKRMQKRLQELLGEEALQKAVHLKAKGGVAG